MDLIKDKMWGWFLVATSQTDLEPDLISQILTQSTTAANCFLSPLPVTNSIFSLGLNYGDKDSVSSEDITWAGGVGWDGFYLVCNQ